MLAGCGGALRARVRGHDCARSGRRRHAQTRSSDSARSGAAFRMRSTGKRHADHSGRADHHLLCAAAEQLSDAVGGCARGDHAARPDRAIRVSGIDDDGAHRSAEARTCSRERTTGGACTRFCVKTAAADAGGSETISATSSALRCGRASSGRQEAEAKRNPRGRARAVRGSLIF